MLFIRHVFFHPKDAAISTYEVLHCSPGLLAIAKPGGPTIRGDGLLHACRGQCFCNGPGIEWMVR